jgi:hypothetical protein
MAKDKKISELPEITQAAVMGLSRSGIVTINDLVAAEFDKVAYLLEDYNEARRLVTEAHRLVEQQQQQSQGGGGGGGGRRSRNQNAAPQAPAQPPPQIPGPLGQKIVGDQPEPSLPRAALDPTRFARPQLLRIPPPPPTDSPLQHAMAIATRGLTLSDNGGHDESRAALAKRLSVAGLLLRYGASGNDVIAALVLEPAEAGAVSADEVASRFGPKVERTLEECASLRAVPMLPSGKLPRYYLDMARSSPLSARRVCAAFLPYLTEGPHGSGVSAQAYARLLCEALEAGGHDELIAACRAAMETGVRAAA